WRRAAVTRLLTSVGAAMLVLTTLVGADATDLVRALAGDWSQSAQAAAPGQAALAWGNNGAGELGRGDAGGWSAAPDLVAAVGSPLAVAGGGEHTLILQGDGTVWTAGANQFGQLGDGGTVDASVPAPVPGLSRIVAVAAGELHSLALRSDGSVWSWGRNSRGQL